MIQSSAAMPVQFAGQKKLGTVVRAGAMAAALATGAMATPAKAHGDHSAQAPNPHVHVHAGHHDIPVWLKPLAGLLLAGAAGVGVLAFRKKGDKTDKE